MIEKVDLSRVDVITCFELIEHLYAPEDLLVRCHQLLGEDGLLVLTLPNIKGFDLLVLGHLSDNILAPQHLNYFHPKSISFLLRRLNFEVLELSTPGQLDAELVRKKILAGDFDSSNSPFLQHILVDRWEDIGSAFQEFLAGNGLSSHLWAVARKVS
jgi:hypothetical protein